MAVKKDRITKRQAAKKKERFHLQVGRARPTDQYITLRTSKKSVERMTRLANGNGVLNLTEQDLVTAIENYTRPKAEAIIDGPEINLSNIIKMEGRETIPVPEELNILLEANKIIYGDREQAYGNPRFNLDTIAQLWSVYFQRKFYSWGIDGANFTAEDVAQLMILLKTARLIHNPTHVDSLTDQAGYAALQHRIQGIKP